ncbi:MAG TPA: hypothetical protein VFX92_13670 [Candidatus Krumholzibacteria bacterium]|nr:hypothetical protein [Candidatus Krumholzibacteria bacterium]
MEHCAYCGENVGNDGLFVDEDVFCSEQCMRDYGAGDSYGGDDDDDEDDDDDFEDDDDDDDDDDEEDSIDDDDDY